MFTYPSPPSFYREVNNKSPSSRQAAPYRKHYTAGCIPQLGQGFEVSIGHYKINIKIQEWQQQQEFQGTRR